MLAPTVMVLLNTALDLVKVEIVISIVSFEKAVLVYLVGGVWVFADRNNESPVIPMERIEPQRHQLYNWFRTKSFTLLAHANCEGYLK